MFVRKVMTRGTVCVYCRRRPISTSWRPFCSENCKLRDLQGWLDEDYRIPGEEQSSHMANDGSTGEDKTEM